MDRTEVPLQDRWNIEAFYPSLEDWKKDFTHQEGKAEGDRWPQLTKFRGRLGEGPHVVRELLEAALGLERRLYKLYTYAHLRHDEDVGNDAYKEAYLKATGVIQELRKESSWIEPELLQLSQKQLDELLASEVLKPYRFYLEKIIRLKPHTLDAAQEELLAGAQLALDAPERAFGAFNNADLKFPDVQDSQGQWHPLTHGKYAVYLRNPDRELRKNTFLTLHRAFGIYENTLCELIQGEIQKHRFYQKARSYGSCLEAALFPHHIDSAVYKNLIATVRNSLPLLHRYMAFRKEVLGFEELHLYDMNIPLVGDVDIKMDFETAARFIVESIKPLGSDYQQDLHKGFFQNRWVDRYENDRKRSGGYSSGCFDSMPYILMNYYQEFNSIMTLSHEAGHSMHSLLAWRRQPYHYSAYPIFLAEIASTFHEELTLRHFLATTEDPLKRAFLINQQIEAIRNTFFRQVMFAEFELKLHQFVEQGIPLTPTLLKKEYGQLVADYFGPAVTLDREIDIEWARVPHFYYNFYVYQYATGISAAHALVELVLKEGSKQYLEFLSAGGSHYPLDLLKATGVDLRSPAALEATLHHFENLTKRLEQALENIHGSKTP